MHQDAPEKVEQGHQPVLLAEALEQLAIRPGGLYVDVTFGAGGHTRAILEAEPTCRVIALDWDRDALQEHAVPLQQQFGDRFIPIWSSFTHVALQLKKRKLGPIDGLLADFGTSRTQLKGALSFASDAPLDMRMSPAHYEVTAAQIVAEASEKELATIFWEYGEERYAREVARAIVAARKKRPIRTLEELAQLVQTVVSVDRRGRGKPIHPATRVFQALRIVVNHEIENIESLLRQATELLKSGGRLVCISFHSLEDRVVKHFFRERSELFRVLTKKAVIAGNAELERNRSARSAKLRAVEKI